VSTTRRPAGLAADDPTRAPAGLAASAPAGLAGSALAGLAADDPATVPFGFAVTFARAGGYSFPCQHPPRAGMADTFAVS